jgi:hypothetical protein
MSLRPIIAAILGCLLSGPLLGQTSTSKPTIAAEQHYPEQAYLSPTRYTNGFFGFSFELPAAAHLEPLSQQVTADGQIHLLKLVGPAPTDAAVSIVAYTPRSQQAPEAKALLRKALDQELFRGVEELRPLSKTMLAGHLFYFYETRRGLDQHMRAAANLDGYVLLVELGAHSEKMARDLELCFQHVTFFAPPQVGQYLTKDAQAYEGPAISSHRLAKLQADPPQSHIDPGKLEGDIYHNPALGLSYQLPSGWFVEPQGAVLPAIERSRAADSAADLLDGDTPASGATERQLMKACRRTLFSVWETKPDAAGEIPYDDFGEVTLSAISADCFPGVKFPSDPSDQQGFRDFLMLLGPTHPILRDLPNAKAFTAHGAVFLLLHGTVAFKLPHDELSRRLSVAMAITTRRGYLLTWFFAAPHNSELEPLLQERAGFDPEPAATDASATQAGSPDSADKAGAPAATGSTSSANVPGGGSTGDSAAANSSATASGDPSQAQSDSSKAPPTRPTLLRPGESMQNQQGNGPPVRKH